MPAFVVGDVHGHLDLLLRLLRDAGLFDARDRWAGADARLWLLGDLVDRGPDGIGCVELAMRLEAEGVADCLLGNHEPLLLGARRFGGVGSGGPGGTFAADWYANGGILSDLERLEPEHVAWIERRPAAALVGDTLLLHADSDRYLDYGSSPDAVNRNVRAVLSGEEAGALDALLGAFSDRGAFARPDAVDRVLGALGGARIVHGHTPISYATGTPDEEVTAPLVYGAGRVWNVDHGLYRGGRGFVTELPASRHESGRLPG